MGFKLGFLTVQNTRLENKTIGLLSWSFNNHQKAHGIQWDTVSETFQFNPDRNSRPDRAPKTYQWDIWDRIKYKTSESGPFRNKKRTEARQFSQSLVNVPYPYHSLHFGSNKTLRKCYNNRALFFQRRKFLPIDPNGNIQFYGWCM
jgi:hypothetical protein